MKQRNEFSKQEQQAQKIEQHVQSETPVEFATAEELLRHDRQQIPIPPTIAERLRESLGAEPQPKTAWWKRIFGGTK